MSGTGCPDRADHDGQREVRSDVQGPELVAVGPEAARVVSALHHAAFSGRDPWDETACGQILALPGVEAWLVCVSDVPVGFIISRHVLDEGEVLSLGVHPQWQRQGLAHRLLSYLINRARQEAATLFLEVRLSNEAAFALYGRCGFQQIAVRRRYYDDGEDARLLRWSP